MPTAISRILEARGAGRCAFSPDGRTLYYVTDLTGTSQLWSVPASGGMPRRLTFECDRVGAYRPSPDGRHVGYGADEGGNERWGLWTMRADGGGARRVTERPDRIHHLVGWTGRGDGLVAFANLRDPRFFDLYTFPFDGGGPSMLFRRDGTGFRAALFGDGRIVVATNRGRGDLQHLTLIGPGGEVRSLTPDEPAALHAEPCPFGDAVLVRSDRGQDIAAIARVGLDGSFVILAGSEREVEDLDACGTHWTYAVNVDGYSEVHVVSDGEDRVVRGLPRGALAADLIGGSLALAADGTVGVAWGRYDAPPALYVARPDRQAEMIVPPVACLDESDLPGEQLVSWPSFDGRRIPGFLLRPRGAPPGARPTVVQVHGGPEGQARPLWNPLTVALVAAGFNVLQPNVRGSSGYGRAYKSLDDVRLRMDSVRDLDAAAEYLASERIAPADRIGVMGGSYGGFMTLAAIAFCHERNWAAAVDIVGIANWATFFERTDSWRRPLREAEYGSLERDRDFLQSISPISRLEAIRAPLMVIHGANDPRVPVHEAEQIVAAMRERGRAVEYLRYEDEGHGLAKAKNRAHAWPKVVAFFRAHLGSP